MIDKIFNQLNQNVKSKIKAKEELKGSTMKSSSKRREGDLGTPKINPANPSPMNASDNLFPMANQSTLPSLVLG